jgi:hypothetical protein
MTQPLSNPDSILDSIKKAIGIASDYDVYDPDLMMHINSVFSTLHQLGIGPVEGFMITGADEQWNAFLGSDPLLNNVKSYVFIRVRLLFDPPATSFAQESLKEQAREFEWRINVYRETKLAESLAETAPTNPIDSSMAGLSGVYEIDGGGADMSD